ncbi:WD40/YVTN/BNR-like repeat-containing protein [Thalassotalea sp. PLHSN55]|uniref:WD40/YVTN/BNR-like repeat-containing protein n=1 Tax=Thalassotalea sp. PLHSN55 TaxID=3435888 RepID=UPI003F870E2A
MKYLFTFLLTSVLNFPLFAADTNAASDILPSRIAPLAQHSLLLDITNVADQKLVAVGQYGHILISSNATQWQQAQVPVQATLTGVYFLDEKLGWVVGHDATILHTADGGMTWQLQQYLPELEKPLFDVVFKDERNGIALGAYGQLFRTTDGGKHWQFEFHGELLPPEDVEYLEEIKLEDEEAYLDEISSILPHFNRIYMDGRTLYLVGEIGLIAKSNDFGRTWEKFDEIYQGSFFDISRTSKGNLLIVGLRGNVFRSLKNGTPWQKIATGTTSLLNSIVLSDDDRVFLLGNNGTLLISEDDGISFVKKVQPDGKPLIAGEWFNNQLVVVSEVGIKNITITK